MIGVYELDGLHWAFGVMWALFMAWSGVCAIVLSRRTKNLGEKEHENQRLREALQLYQSQQVPLETSKEPNC